MRQTCGDNGTDTFTVQDAGSAGAINYTFSNPFGAGTQNKTSTAVRPITNR